MIVDDQIDYVLARRRIHEALIEGSHLRIVVSDTILSNWFWDILQHHDVIIKDMDLRRSLEKVIGVPLPDVITTGMIEEFNLLDAGSQKPISSDPIVWFAGIVLGPSWGAVKPSPDHLKELFSWFIDNLNKVQGPDVESLIDVRLAQWQEQTSGKISIIYGDLKLQRYAAIRFFCAWDMLSGYPESLRREWLENIHIFSPEREKLAAGLEGLPRHPDMDKALQQFVVPYWNRRFQDRIVELRDAGA